MSTSRPTRGAVRLDGFPVDPAALRADLSQFSEADWDSVGYGENWSHIQLVRPGKDGALIEHPRLASSPAIRTFTERFGSRLMDLSLARLGPGGSVKEHRDISGGIPMGVGRFHLPIVTHSDVEFYVSGKRVVMAEGEVWNLDTTYPHRLLNSSQVWRVHLIADFELNDRVRALLPPRELRDHAHRAYFWLICVSKGISLALRSPGALWKRATSFLRLLVFGKSVLRFEKD